MVLAALVAAAVLTALAVLTAAVGCRTGTPVDAEGRRERRAWWAVELATRHCMSAAGVEGYGLTPTWSDGDGPRTAEAWLAGRDPARRGHDAEVLLGRRGFDGRADTSGLHDDELWKATGCAGRALHEVGTD